MIVNGRARRGNRSGFLLDRFLGMTVVMALISISSLMDPSGAGLPRVR